MTAAEHEVLISIGSNLGDPLANCRKGIAALKDVSSSVSVSSFYRTEPVGYTDQEWFVNAAAAIRTRLEPIELLVFLQSTQKEMGRVEDTIRFGPRVIDLDILLYDDRVFQTPELIIPHPRMHERRFVLQPLCDLVPERLHPQYHLTMIRLLERVSREGQTIEKIDGQDVDK